MWNKPWKYREGIAISIGLLITGALLQAAVGPMEWLIFMWPANIIVLGILIALLAVFYALRSKVYLFRFMTQAEAAVPALATASVLTVIMGLTRQVSENHPAMDPIGLSKMLSFWPFILTYLWNIVIIAEVFIHQAIHFKKRYIPSLVCHLGLFVFVTCGVLGSADMQRLKMYCEEGTPEWRAIDDYKMVKELPFAIELQKFAIEENPVKYISDVNIYTKEGTASQARIEVNKPYSVGSWKVYQYSYQLGRGHIPNVSIFELVSDPWLPATYAGICLLLAGAVLMFITAGRKEEKK
jgi:uncharacterized membrane protein YozB (DUF420 family)